MVVGFTGTQQGWTPPQRKGVEQLLQRLGAKEVHHGDCVGSDAQLAELCTLLAIRQVVHPPDNDKKRAFCHGDVVLPSKPYGTRNIDIVRSCELLIATPAQRHEVLRSGTWSTIRFAQKIAKPVIIVWPDGCEVET